MVASHSTSTTLVLSRRDVLDLLTLRDCIDAVERAFLLHAQGAQPGAGRAGGPRGGRRVSHQGGRPRRRTELLRRQDERQLPGQPAALRASHDSGHGRAGRCQYRPTARDHGFGKRDGVAHGRRDGGGGQAPRPPRCADSHDRWLRRPGRDPARGHRCRPAIAARLGTRHRPGPRRGHGRQGQRHPRPAGRSLSGSPRRLPGERRVRDLHAGPARLRHGGRRCPRHVPRRRGSRQSQPSRRSTPP